MPFETHAEPIESVPDLLELVLALRAECGGLPLWYRGLTDATHSLVPSIGRGEYSVEYERSLGSNFKKNAIPFVERRPTSDWEWLFLMRHHNVPTRLLDWSESPPVALFFSVTALEGESDRRDERDGVIWVLRPTQLNRSANITFELDHELPMFEERDRHLRNYSPATLWMEGTSEALPVAGIPVRQSRRMEMQHSVFTVTHRLQTGIEEAAEDNTLLKVIVPAAAKPRIRDELRALSFKRLTLFPDLDNVGRDARRLG